MDFYKWQKKIKCLIKYNAKTKYITKKKSTIKKKAYSCMKNGTWRIQTAELIIFTGYAMLHEDHFFG